MISIEQLNALVAQIPPRGVYSIRWTSVQHDNVVSVPVVNDSFHDAVKSMIAAQGFARVQLLDISAPHDSLRRVADALQLPVSLIPQQYSRDNLFHQKHGFNEVAAKDGNHRGFQSREAQELHVDGTLEKIGAVPTSMMLCVMPAAHGGLTRLFNGAAAFLHLYREDPRLVLPLMDIEALIRKDLGGTELYQPGPIFGFSGERLISRFSVDNTSDWNITGRNGLQTSKEALLQLAEINSGFYLEFPLLKGQVIILANDLVSHGRTAYEDTEAQRRLLLRGLFTAAV